MEIHTEEEDDKEQLSIAEINPLSVNAYAYCENNPINFSDSTGYEGTSDAGSVIGDLVPQIVILRKIVKVYRHCLFLNPFMIFRGFNDTILISQIKDVYRPKNKDKFLKPIPVNVIDWNNMLIIEINNSLNT